MLVVDDTPLNLTVVRGLLKDTRVQIVTAESGQATILIPEDLFYGAGFAEDAVLTVPKEIQQIGKNAFAKSTLRHIAFEEGSQLTAIAESAFDGSCAKNH